MAKRPTRSRTNKRNLRTTRMSDGSQVYMSPQALGGGIGVRIGHTMTQAIERIRQGPVRRRRPSSRNRNRRGN